MEIGFSSLARMLKVKVFAWEVASGGRFNDHGRLVVER